MMLMMMMIRTLQYKLATANSRRMICDAAMQKRTQSRTWRSAIATHTHTHTDRPRSRLLLLLCPFWPIESGGWFHPIFNSKGQDITRYTREN